MDRSALERLLIQARWQASKLTTVGKIGAGLLMLAFVFFMAAISPQNEELEKLAKKAASLQQQTRLKSGESVRLDDNQALQVFYDFFPSIDSSPYWIKELDRVAKKRGLS